MAYEIIYQMVGTFEVIIKRDGVYGRRLDIKDAKLEKLEMVVLR